MEKWIPTIVALITGSGAAIYAQDWIAANPLVATILAAVAAVIAAILPSPLKK